MKHARDMVNILQIAADAIRSIMDQGVSTVTNVKKTMIAVYKANALIYMEPLCQNVNVTVISAGSDQIAQKVSNFMNSISNIIKQKM